MYTEMDESTLLRNGDPRPLRVLLVEDSKVLALRMTDTLLGVEGIDLVGTAEGEREAVSMANRAGVDVVILDLHLRQGTGFGVLRELKASKWRPTVIVLTNYDLPEYKIAALELGASHFLDKARDYARLPELLVSMQ